MDYDYSMSYYHRHSIRLKGFDYSQNGYYFVTICVQNREWLLGNIGNGEMTLSEAGIIIKKWWNILPGKYFQIQLDEYVIMPNHFHGIVVINHNVGAIHELPLQHDHPSKTNEMIMRRRMLLPLVIGYFKMNASKQINVIRNTLNHPVWQRNYFEHIIRNEKQYWAIKQYIQDNVKNWEMDELFTPSSTLP
jgi:putative transposase